jgi:hypothetical protein
MRRTPRLAAFRAAGLDPPRPHVLSFSIPVHQHLLATGRFLTTLPISMLLHSRQWSLKLVPMYDPTGVSGGGKTQGSSIRSAKAIPRRRVHLLFAPAKTTCRSSNMVSAFVSSSGLKSVVGTSASSMLRCRSSRLCSVTGSAEMTSLGKRRYDNAT